MTRRVCLILLFLVPLALHAGAADAQTVVGLGATGFFEDSTLNGEEQISLLESDQSYDYYSDNFLTASLFFLLKMSDRLRSGSALEYYGTYASRRQRTPEQRRNPDYEPPRYEFGRLLEFYGRVDYAVPVVPDVDLLLGGVFGVPVLFPAGDFKEDIQRLQDEGISTTTLPRIGYLVGPDLAVRWKYNDHLYLRGDTMIKWEQMFLYRFAQTIDGTAMRRRWTTGTVRYHFTIGAEIPL